MEAATCFTRPPSQLLLHLHNYLFFAHYCMHPLTPPLPFPLRRILLPTKPSPTTPSSNSQFNFYPLSNPIYASLMTQSTKRKTKVVKKTLSPSWDQALVWDIAEAEASEDVLQVSLTCFTFSPSVSLPPQS